MSEHDTGVDAYARGLHARSLEHLSPRVQAQLALRRNDALAGRARRAPHALLPWAGMATAAVALALVLQLRPPAGTASNAGDGPRATVTATDVASPRLAMADAYDVAPELADDPEFYVWLGERPVETE